MSEVNSQAMFGRRARKLCVCVCLFGLQVCTGQFVYSNDTGERPWRSAENGAVNTLYCYLRIRGCSCDYQELCRIGNTYDTFCNSAADLCDLSEKHGNPLVAASLTKDKLLSCSFPVIVHIDGDSPTRGAFLLLLNVTSDDVYYVNGPSATITQMDRESFFRVWSTVAMLPKGELPWRSLLCLVGVLTGAMLPYCIDLTRRRALS